MTCTCIEKVEKLLAPKNTRLKLAFTIPWRVLPLVATEAIETGRGKAKPVAMHPRFCPFCGVEYEQTAETEIKKDEASNG